ncbi:MAG: bacillithiol biosynthesis BshC, partial [Bdellovibrionales bacterium]|nr:bacillithiol biosynthesis BshC [Bdellovibrionales bacterium]
MSEYYADFISGAGLSDDFFHFSYLEPVAVRAAIEKAVERVVPAAVLDELDALNADLGTQVARNLKSLRSGGCAAVITGQQLGFLGGPLLTLYKIVSCIQTARTLSEES